MFVTFDSKKLTIFWGSTLHKSWGFIDLLRPQSTSHLGIYGRSPALQGGKSQLPKEKTWKTTGRIGKLDATWSSGQSYICMIHDAPISDILFHLQNDKKGKLDAVPWKICQIGRSTSCQPLARNTSVVPKVRPCDFAPFKSVPRNPPEADVRPETAPITRIVIFCARHHVIQNIESNGLEWWRADALMFNLRGVNTRKNGMHYIYIYMKFYLILSQSLRWFQPWPDRWWFLVVFQIHDWCRVMRRKTLRDVRKILCAPNTVKIVLVLWQTARLLPIWMMAYWQLLDSDGCSLTEKPSCMILSNWIFTIRKSKRVGFFPLPFWGSMIFTSNALMTKDDNRATTDGGHESNFERVDITCTAHKFLWAPDSFRLVSASDPNIFFASVIDLFHRKPCIWPSDVKIASFFPFNLHSSLMTPNPWKKPTTTLAMTGCLSKVRAYSSLVCLIGSIGWSTHLMISHSSTALSSNMFLDESQWVFELREIRMKGWDGLKATKGSLVTPGSNLI